MMEDMERSTRLKTLAGDLETLVAFADEEQEFALAAKLEDARLLFEDRYGVSTR